MADNLEDIVHMMEMDDWDGSTDPDSAPSASTPAPGPTSQSQPRPLYSPPRKALQDLTYEDLFGSPEKKKPRKSEIEGSSSSSIFGKSKVEACSSSAMSYLGSKPVAPGELKRVTGGLDTATLFTDSFSLIRLYKTSIALYCDEEGGTTLDSVMKMRNFGLEYVSLLNLPFWYKTKGSQIKNFWTSGVLARKQPGVRKSAKGNEYTIWEINDLKQLDKSWTVFLFSSAANASSLSAVGIGSLIDLTTPAVMDSKDGGPLKLSVNNSMQIRLIGTAKDFGFCQSKRKDGKPCTAVVNTWECCTCIHHAGSELKKLRGSSGSGAGKARRKLPPSNPFDNPPSWKNQQNPEAEGIRTINFGPPPPQSKLNSGVGLRSNLGAGAAPKAKLPINKVVLPPKNNTRMELQGTSVCNEFKRNSISMGNASSISFVKENKISRPSSSSSTFSLDPSKTRHLNDKERALLAALSSPTKKPPEEKDLKQKRAAYAQPCPVDLVSRIATTPTAGSLNFMKYLAETDKQNDPEGGDDKKVTGPITMTRETFNSMKKALDFVKTKGPIPKKNPNAVSSKRKSLPSSSSASEPSTSSASKNKSGRKSRIEVEFDFDSDEFKKILNAKSAHEDHANSLHQEQYFDKLVKQEAIENKLLNTFTIATNAVMCKQCKYVAVSQSDYCRDLHHTIRIVKATKRFFKCKDCGTRTMSLDRLPKKPCKQCNSSSWEAAPVGQEKKGPVLPTEVLAVRGHEEKFIGSSSSTMFLNLEVS